MTGVNGRSVTLGSSPRAAQLLSYFPAFGFGASFAVVLANFS